MSEYVVLVNRTSKNLEGVWDGRVHIIKPGKNEFPKDKAVKFVEQNPVMGSEDPRTGQMTYKLGIEDLHMPIDPLSDEFLAQFDGSIEKWDRSKLVGARPSTVVAGDNGLYSQGTWRGKQSPDVGFVKP